MSLKWFLLSTVRLLLISFPTRQLYSLINFGRGVVIVDFRGSLKGSLRPGGKIENFLTHCRPTFAHTKYKKGTKKGQNKSKTYNSRYSLVVTHPTTNLPIYSLNMGERTGSLVLCSLWSYVKAFVVFKDI
jgi:hypothetical protein